jgi:hypothetical protein
VIQLWARQKKSCAFCYTKLIIFFLEKATTSQIIQLTITEGDTNGKILTCKSNLPVICDKGSTVSCDLQIWLYHRNLNAFNRVMIKKCNKLTSNYSCEGCNKALKRNPNNLNDLNEISWTLVANLEAGNLNYLDETYYLDIKSNKNSVKFRPFWNNVNFPYIKVIFDP